MQPQRVRRQPLPRSTRRRGAPLRMARNTRIRTRQKIIQEKVIPESIIPVRSTPEKVKLGTMTNEYRIAIVGASSLLAKELKECLTESPLASARFLLLDEQGGQGQLEQVGDEVTVVQPLGPGSFEGMDFTFFAGSE